MGKPRPRENLVIYLPKVTRRTPGKGWGNQLSQPCKPYGGNVFWRARAWASELRRGSSRSPGLTSLGSPDPVSILCSSSSTMTDCCCGFNTSSNSGTYSTSGSRRTCKGHSADIRRSGRKCGRLVVVANTRSDWHVLLLRGREWG